MGPRFFRSVPHALALLLLFFPAGHAETAVPQLPPGVSPLPPASARHLDDLLHAAEKYRGLKAKRPVPSGSLSPQALKAKVAESMGKDYPPEALKAMEVSLKAFGLIPETMDLRRYLPELLSSQVAGFYDPERKYLALVDLPGGGSGKPAVDQDMTLVHELTHALQDQSFDLHRFEGGDPMADAGTAGEALVEGDATLTMLDFNAQARLETVPGFGAAFHRMLREPEKLAESASASDLPGAREMNAAPAWIRDTLLFSYLQGAGFCMEVRRRGGQKLLDYAFTTDPPRSTEQILHPEKWYGRRDDPVVLHLPDLSAELPGYRKAAEGEMGELSVRIYLRENLKDIHLANAERANAAAAGWGGDRFAVYERDAERDTGRLVVWVTEWDTDADAGEFRSALAGLSGWRVEAAGPRRVLGLLGSLADERWAAVRARLAAVAAERPADKDIDLKAIGVPADPEATARPAIPSPAGGR